MIIYALVLAGAVHQGPSRDSLLAEGIRLAPMQPAAALTRFDALLAADSTDATAGRLAAVALNDLAQELRDPAARPQRDSLYALAERDARRAVRLVPNSAAALFALGLVLGNEALGRGVKERIRMAVEIRSLALLALAADSMHDGAHHLLGRWHYEVRKLSGLQRFMARNFLGGKVLGEASWDEARRHLERAVSLDPLRLYHRLDLARVALATGDTATAIRELRQVLDLPRKVLADARYQLEAGELLRPLQAKG
jgi:tetratricopeptide (TPR) repeat protein